MNRYLLAAASLLLAACSRPSSVKVVRLVDIFDTAKIDGTPTKTSVTPAALWDFTAAPKDAADPMLGWKAGDGVTGLKVVDGKLTGRSSTDFPVIYVNRPKAVDVSDEFHSVQVRMRVTDGGNVSANAEEAPLIFPAIIGKGRGFRWSIQSPLIKGPEMQILTLPVVR